ncbi:MAG: sugar ABC transporter ATP-binding protein [Pirellulales bacterium]
MLETLGVGKSFPGVQALAGVSLGVAPGEVVSVVGENGAGKSTLMKILAGVQTPDEGTLRLDGRDVRFANVDAAQQAGISLIHQELNLAESLDVAGNIFLGREPRFGGPLGWISSSIYRDAEVLMRRLGLDCEPTTLVRKLSLGQRQLVEIARALSLNSRYIIFDEPTSSLTDRETERLFEVIRGLKAAGVGVLYISHRLHEVRLLSDRVVVLRDGRNAGDLRREEITHEALVARMVGRELKQFFHRTHRASVATGEQLPAVEVSDVRWSPKQRQGISLGIRAGEIVGMAGLMGSGRTEFAETLFGLRRMTSGIVRIAGREIHPASPTAAARDGIALVPEDRRHQGLVINFSIRENIGLPSLARLQTAGLVRQSAERELAETSCKQLAVRTTDVEKAVGLLSGGNQQKVVLAKWLARSPKLLILDEPTRGVDVGAKADIYGLMDQLAAGGAAILMISSDLEEILGVSDRVVVMHEQQLAGELRRDQLSEQAVMLLATGKEHP